MTPYDFLLFPLILLLIYFFIYIGRHRRFQTAVRARQNTNACIEREREKESPYSNRLFWRDGLEHEPLVRQIG